MLEYRSSPRSAQAPRDLGQSRFTDPRFAGEQHDLTFATLRLRPAPQQQFKFFFAPDEFGQSAGVQSIEAALDRRGSQRGPCSPGPCDAFEVLRSKVLKLEQVTNEPPRALR